MVLLNLVAGALAVVTLGIASEIAIADERAIQLDGVQNTRDLGGLRTEDGRTVRKGQLIRSGEIDDLSSAGMARLDNMGVNAIVDLRTTKEATAAPVRWPRGEGPVRFNFPVMEQESAKIDGMRASIKAGTAKEADTEVLFSDAFSYIATDYTAEIRSLFEVILAQPEGEAVLFHCSGGKDRTGIATALVLSALGVTKSEIEADFMMSNTLKDADRSAAKIASEVNAAQGTNMTPAAVWPSVGVRKTYLDEFYESVRSNYGSVDGYLRKGLGLTDTELQALRDRYLN